jgi:hypothetical protein
MNLSDIIIGSAESLLLLQEKDGSFPAGHNGPYYDEELPLRNTGHVLMILLKAYELSGKDIYLKAALKALSYITDDERRPMGATFWVRKNPQKDFSNGLIGQAWVIEALAYAAESLNDDSLNKLAEEVFLLHPFDEQTGRWQVVNVDGSYGPVDMTFNHQLWFAAAGSLLQGSEVIQGQVKQFMNKLDSNLELYDNGLIVHALGGNGHKKQSFKKRLKRLIKAQLLERGKAPYENEVINKAIGYHAFNTHGFSLLYNNTKDHQFWQSKTYSQILNFLLTDLFRNGLNYFLPDAAHKGKVLPFNRLGYSYNPPGFEVAFTVQTFKEHYKDEYEKLISMWLGRQIERTLDSKSSLMNKQTDDTVTLSARMYEAVRLKEYQLEISLNP